MDILLAVLRCVKAWLCSQIRDPLSLYNVRTRWLEEIRAHSRAPVLLCGCMADLRTDENTVRYEIFSHQFSKNISPILMP